MSQPRRTDHRSNGASGPLCLRLYVVPGAPNSERAVNNLVALLEGEGLEGSAYELVDVAREPMRALGDGVLLTPTLLRLSPEPVVRVVGDLSDRAQVMRALGI